MDVVITKSI